jgi:long-subunit fatty acid transport protein
MVQLGASIALHPTFAIGASANIIISRIDVYKDLDLANQTAITMLAPCSQNPLGCENPALSTQLHIAGTGVSGGAAVGAMWQPIRQLRFGASYFSPVKVNVGVVVSVDAQKLSDFARQFVPGFLTLAVNGGGTATLTVPQRVHFAVAVDVHPRVELMAMMRWTNFSATEIIDAYITSRSSTIVPEELHVPAVKNDEWMVTARVVGRVRERWKLGLSIEYATKTVPDAYMTPSNLDFDAIAFNAGANVRIWRELYLGMSFSQTAVIPRTVTKSTFANDNIAPYNLPDPSGSYVGNSEKLGLDLTAKF